MTVSEGCVPEQHMGQLVKPGLVRQGIDRVMGRDFSALRLHPLYMSQDLAIQANGLTDDR